MSTYRADVRLQSDPTSTVSAYVHLGNGRVRVTSGGVTLGDWARADLKVYSQVDGMHLQINGEDVFLRTLEPGLLEELLAVDVEDPDLAEGSGGASQSQPHPERGIRTWAIVVGGVLVILWAALIPFFANLGDTEGQALGASLAAPSSSNPSDQIITGPTVTTAGTLPSPSTSSSASAIGALGTTTTTSATTATSTTVSTVAVPTTETTTATSTTVTPATSTTVTTATSTTVTTTATSTTTAPPVKKTQIGDGTWIVGRDIDPGAWESFGLRNTCVWARLRGPVYTQANIIESGGGGGGANVPEKVGVNIRASDVAFYTSGCGVWNRLG